MEFADLLKLEKILISKWLPYKPATLMPKGGFTKITGTICNVPINVDDACKLLTRPMDQNGVARVCLKKSLNFKFHVYFQPVRPRVIQSVL